MKSIDITPTWESLIPAFIALIENGTAEGRALAISELQRLGRIADRANAAAKKAKAAAQ